MCALKQNNRAVCFVGTLPPPVHGASFVNERIVRDISNLASAVYEINLSNQQLSRGWKSKVSRIKTASTGFIEYLRHIQKWTTLYISISGGYGQIYDCIFISIARLLRKSIYVHHHNYTYLNKKSFLTKMLTDIGGENTTHVVLSEKMGEQLLGLYKRPQQYIAVSNTAIIDCSTKRSRVRKAIQVIGFLSNITEEKGILTFLDVLDQLEKRGLLLDAKIAGPFDNKNLENKVMTRINKLRSAEYVGPMFGKSKDEFYENIDLLVFPTKYPNEAEPLVVYESISRGIPVIVTDRGCIADMFSTKAGAIIADETAFVREATDKILFWVNNPDEYQASSAIASVEFGDKRKASLKSYEALIDKIVGDGDYN